MDLKQETFILDNFRFSRIGECALPDLEALALGTMTVYLVHALLILHMAKLFIPT